MTSRTMLLTVVLFGAAACKRAEEPAIPAIDVTPEQLALTYQLGGFIASFEALGRAARFAVAESAVSRDLAFDGYVLDNADGPPDDLIFEADLYRRGPEGPMATARVRLVVDDRSTATVEVFTSPQPLSPRRAAMAHVRDLALAQTFPGRCDGPYEAVILDGAPFGRKDQWIVYLVPVADGDEVFTGGQARLHVTLDGRTALDVKPLSAGCGHPLLAPKTAKIIMIERARLNADVPLENHTYLSVRYDLPVSLTIVPGRLMWLIDPKGPIHRMLGQPKQHKRRR